MAVIYTISVVHLINEFDAVENSNQNLAKNFGLIVDDQLLETRNHSDGDWCDMDMLDMPMRWELGLNSKLSPRSLVIRLSEERTLIINLAIGTTLLDVTPEKFQYLPNGNVQETDTSREWTLQTGNPYSGPRKAFSVHATIKVENEGYTLDDGRGHTYFAKFHKEP